MLANMTVHGRMMGALATISTIVFTSILSGSPANADQITVPPVGTHMRWDCKSPWNDSYEATIVEVGNDKVKWDLNWSSDGSGDGISDVWAWVTSVNDERKVGSKRQRMTLSSGSLAGIADLEVGKKVSAWYRQWHSEWGKNRWEYKLEVVEEKDVDAGRFGTQTVYVIKEKRYSPEWNYSSKMTTHYAPGLSNIIYWIYTDSDNKKEECNLTEMN